MRCYSATMDESCKVDTTAERASDDPLKGAKLVSDTFLGMREFSDVLRYGVLPLVTWRPPGVYVDHLKRYYTGPNSKIVAIDYNGHFVHATSKTIIGGVSVLIRDPETGMDVSADIMSGEHTGLSGRMLGGGCTSHMLWALNGLRYATSFASHCPHTVACSRVDIVVGGAGECYVLPCGASLSGPSPKYAVDGQWINYGYIGMDIIFACARIRSDVVVHIVNAKQCSGILRFTIPNVTGRILYAALCGSYIVTVESGDRFYITRVHNMRGKILCTKMCNAVRYGVDILVYPNLDKFAIIYSADHDTHNAAIDVYQISRTATGTWCNA